jgi:pimeloyl-ACP methyl ester carboxylesterase
MTGSAPPTLCLIHGAGGSALSWIRQLEGLADAASVVAIDLPGHGQSGGDGCSSVEEYAALVERFVETLELGRIVLGGHSMGGAVALTFALMNSHLIEGLILAGTGARLKVLPEIFERLQSDYAQGCAFVTDLGFSPTAPEGLKNGVRTGMRMMPPQVTIGDFTACNNFDVMDRTGTLKVPTLAVCGQDDRLTPPNYSRFLAERISLARLAVVEQAGHYVHLEQPDTVNAAIRQFLFVLGSPR